MNDAHRQEYKTQYRESVSTTLSRFFICFKPMLKATLTAVVLTVLVSCSDSSVVPPVVPSVVVQRVPNDGIHPRIMFDEWGDTHLLYFRAEFPDSGAYSGHLYYTRYDNSSGLHKPVLLS